MDQFAIYPDQFRDQCRNTIYLKPCDGSCNELTLESQLIRLGIIHERWSLKEMQDLEDVPGTIFYWVKHVAASNMEPDYMKVEKDRNWHCGICFHAISNIYYYNRSTTDAINLNATTDIVLPPTIVSGSECIHLADELRALTKYLLSHGYANGRVEYSHGRIDARCVFDAFRTWPTEEVALPLEWFYLKPSFRRGLISDHPNATLRGHVSAYMLDKSVPRKMKRALTIPRYVAGRKFFDGKESDGTTVVDVDSDGQTANSPWNYVIVDRTAARIMARPSRYLTEEIYED